MAEFCSSTSDDTTGDRLEAEIVRHRELLRGAVAEHWRRVDMRLRFAEPAVQRLLVKQAERLVDGLMIDPERHRDLDVDAYRVVRDGVPLRYDARRRRFVAQRGRREILIRPDGQERRLGIIARLAAGGVDVDQILTVATVVISHPEFPGAAPARGPRRDDPFRQAHSRATMDR
ncbi:hypothetical protein [Nocardia mexicana]|uniref:Uncharacterized protein n=1 Tax=Nocardia mexicana TaxID=279262 RepID=A0A370GWM3_9NOCA|nr:hypothetical protein [Nocardia mexicana]RDI46323.1 hypothetical protein DFR68_11181 [Nocardia mexicana]